MATARLVFGVMRAWHWETGNRPCTRDALTMLVTYGNSRSINSRSKKVGTRSKEEDLVGDAIIIRCTSASVHGVNAINDAAN